MTDNTIYDLEIHKEYRRRDLHSVFKGQMQGGISTPAKYDVVLLFSSNKSSNIYSFEDGWNPETGLYYYVGEGQVGDMTFQGGNKAIRDHLIDNKHLLLFKYVRQGIVKYLGEFVCLNHHCILLPDRDNNERNAIVFELVPKSDFDYETSEDVDEIYSSENYELSLEQLRLKAMNRGDSASTPLERKQVYYKRCNIIKQYALRRANGVCEGCGLSAPFYTDKGNPFLEVHHIDRIADGGPDEIDAVVALCPNCHRKVHYGQDGPQFNEFLRQKIKSIENTLS
ncbi:HNH endonuclease [Phototrophicus methaneseepsis]|uniref:HNH endonuclease n=1 Tax=Phototrophicus methaneseepsis TaxID=2710758 RepID=A0A7S8IFJ6_9CHLR|nr:HNH endonuclease signature motif containing protein [Phototrophicus methaneseepsis]QPC83549.1 HNH endonuclease [Phototrophicus methaneseepsis]